METFWFFQLRFRRAYDSAYDSGGGGGGGSPPPPPGYDFDFSFSQGHKRSSDSAYESDSVVNSFAISLTSVVSATP